MHATGGGAAAGDDADARSIAERAGIPPVLLSCWALGPRGAVGPDDAATALKHLYLVIVSLDPTGRSRKRWSNKWKAALNAFDITFDGRLSAGRK